MKLAGYALALAGTFAGIAMGQTPTIGGLLNNYSYTLPGLPNYGIAEGSIFDIFGTNLAAATVPLQGPPLQTTLNGVSINVTVNGTTTHPLIYFRKCWTDRGGSSIRNAGGPGHDHGNQQRRYQRSFSDTGGGERLWAADDE